MMMMRLRFFASSWGSAEMPSRSGISISSTATSGLTRSTWLTASRPVRSDAATTISGSAAIQREISPLMTTESSTTITRSGSCCVEAGAEELANAILITHQAAENGTLETVTPRARSAAGSKERRSDEADFLEFRGDDILVERLHDVFVGAGVKRARDVRDIVFGGAEHHLGLVAAGHAAQIAEEFIAVHDRHVPVEQDRIGQSALADFQRLLAVLGFDDLEVEAFQDPPCDLPDDARVVDNKTCSHFSLCFFQIPEGTFPLPSVGAWRCRPHAASMSGTISRTRSTSRTTMSWPSRRCTPPASLAMRGSRS